MVLSKETRFQGCHVVPWSGMYRHHTQCPDPNLEIRRGVGEWSSRPLDKGEGGGEGGSQNFFIGPLGLSLV